jgi:hypothetical protein
MSERIWQQHELQLLSGLNHQTHPHPASYTRLSFPIARLWSCASGLDSSFPSDTSIRVLR